jgi:hypothetical protein
MNVVAPSFGAMTVILADGDQVTCEWLVGIEHRQRAFLASLFRLVFRGGLRAK